MVTRIQKIRNSARGAALHEEGHCLVGRILGFQTDEIFVDVSEQGASGVIARHFPEAPTIYAKHGWRLPYSIDRVYDPGLAETKLGFRCATNFQTVLDALRDNRELPFARNPSYTSAR
jgi:hypothetical protein